MTKLEKMQQQSLKDKVAMMLEVSAKKIASVEESYTGASIRFKDGQLRFIPTKYWIGEEID